MPRKRKKAKKPGMIIRLADRWGYHPGRVMTEVLEWTEVIVVAVGLAAIIMIFVTVRMHVPTDSMWPTINGDPNGWKADSFFVDRITYYFRDPKPGDIVVFRHTEQVNVGRVLEGSAAAAAGVAVGQMITGLNAVPVYTTELAESALASWPEGTSLRLVTREGGSYDLGAKPAGAETFEDLGIVVRERRMRYVKRLIAVGGQTVQIIDGDVHVNGERLEGDRFDRAYYSADPRFRFGVEETLVPEGHYFVLGDNSTDSFDSRYWGFVDDRDIIGVPYLRVWPLTRFGLM
jgi:signal peptidase I